ncbi:MAG TPA: MHYT domain-containing protein [Xanthobacteraceae bacterium]|nr:MHYT domain-containing protein [Xanthobacteraceae bacterium]
MPVTYEAWLVLLSIVMAIQGAYVGLSLAVQIADATGARRRLLLAGATVSLALAIWTMHFVGMLSVRLNFPVDYLVFPTLLSFLVCAIVVGTAVYATSSGPLTMMRLTLSACLMGGGIFSMHYIGMSALDASTYMIHDRVFVAASMAIAIAASGLALWLAAGRGRRPPLLLSAIAFGVAISGMHYTAMGGVTLYPFGPSAPGAAGAPALSTDLLAIIVAVVAFCISGIFLLLLLPDQSRAAAQPIALETVDLEASPAVAIAASPTTVPAAAGANGGNGDDPQFGRGTYAPLGGAGAPPRRFARHLPIEREGGTHFLAVDDVVAVHANAHYTYIFDGSDKLFCPLAIGNVESRLDNSRFVRVHRSHIVNIDRVVGYRRSGDNELVEMAGMQHYMVPVSRSRIGPLKLRVAALTGTDPALAFRRRHRFASQ